MGFILALPIMAVIALIAALFLSMGASVAGIEDRTYGKAFITVVLAGIAGAILGGVLKFVGLNGSTIGLVASATLNLFVIKSVFATGWGKAFIAWLVSMVLTIIVIVVPLMFLFGAAVMASL